ncbi:MAG: WD40 repeat domain-containing protein [Patescibacteria group bacterium]|jgi:WD40 repeat protein
MPDDPYRATFDCRVVGMKFSPISLDLIVLLEDARLVVLGDDGQRKVFLPERVGGRAYSLAVSPTEDASREFPQFVVACDKPFEHSDDTHFLQFRGLRSSSHHLMTIATDHPIGVMSYFKRDGNLNLLYGDTDGKLACFDMQRGGSNWHEPIWQNRVASGPILSLAVSPDGTWAVAGSERPSFVTFDPTSGSEINRRQLSLYGDPIGPVTSLAIGKDTSDYFVYTTSNGAICAHHYASSAYAWFISDSQFDYRTVVAHKNSRTMIAGSNFNTLRIFDEIRGETPARHIATEPSVYFLDVHPFRGWLAICSIIGVHGGVKSKVRVCTTP